MRDGTDLVFVERIAGRSAVGVLTRVGGRFALPPTGVGLVLLAHAPLEVQEEVLVHRSKEQRRVPPSATSSSRARPAVKGPTAHLPPALGASSSLSTLRSASRSGADGGQYTAEHGGMHLVGQAKPCADVAQSLADQRDR